jgi:hypothetical protein
LYTYFASQKGSIGLDMDFSPASVIFSAALAYSTPSKHTGVVVCGFRAKSGQQIFQSMTVISSSFFLWT